MGRAGHAPLSTVRVFVKLIEVVLTPANWISQAVRHDIPCQKPMALVGTYPELNGSPRVSDHPLDRIPAFNRVSIRAVLVQQGQDPGPALAAAGILNPIAIPVVLGEQVELSSGILGDGITPNLTAVLETEYQDHFDA